MSNREFTRPFDALRTMVPVPRFTFVPQEFRQHVRAARREQLLAVRSLLNAAIQRLEETGEPETVHVKITKAE